MGLNSAFKGLKGCKESSRVKVKVKVKVKLALEYAMEAQRGSRDITVLFL
jgi:hypothetical protein